MKEAWEKPENPKRNLPFTVPEDYFEKLPSLIMARLPVTPERAPLISWSWQRSVGLAAAVSLIITLVWVTFPRQQGPLGTERLSQVSNDAILEYLAEENLNYYDLSENNAVQAAFDTDSTVLNYLDGLDQDFLRTQIDPSLISDTTI